VLGHRILVSVLEFLDDGALQATRARFPADASGAAGFMAITKSDGDPVAAQAGRSELTEALEEGALETWGPEEQNAIAALWRGRDGAAIAVAAQRGGNISEAIVVPVEHLAEAIEQTLEIGRRHDLDACSSGHGRDGNLHSTFLIRPDDRAELVGAEHAANELFALAAQLGGSISGEHGLGLASGHRGGQWSPAGIRLHSDIKRLFDPKGLQNPGKKRA
jgi:FAD/FMN-containing dehydrogenase